MSEMTQNERLDYLVNEFLKESVQYRNIVIPDDVPGKKRLLRSLMNIRMPGFLPEQVLKVQDEYLKERSLRNGIVTVESIPTIAESSSRHCFADCISVWKGDITRLAADAIVNAANSQMLGCFVPMHTCIDNCIHTFSGVQLREECSRKMEELRRRFDPDYEQPTAVPMLTEGYNLPAKKVIHVVGPIVSGRLTRKHEKELADCYTNTLDMCVENGIRTVAFCCISTGVFSFPNERAAEIAVNTVTEWMSEHPGTLNRIIFDVFKDEDRFFYESKLQ